MGVIKIFVSHRIDINSEQIKNPLFYSVRCGASFDSENLLNLAGDDTGDNISERRLGFNEFTVQYWAWKNIEADYYGLCHYRRFLSFAEKKYKTNELNMVYKPMLLPSAWKKYGLDQPEKMCNIIKKYDIVTSERIEVCKVPTPMGKKQTVYEFWEAHDGVYIQSSSLNLCFTLIDELYPEYSKSAKEYFNGGYYRDYNCYIMKKDFFFRMCKFQFDIMFEAEKRLNTSGYTKTMMRTPAFLGGFLYGIFIYHITSYENCNIKEQQLVYFNNTDKITGLPNLIYKSIADCLIMVFRGIANPIFPSGSKRREMLKKFIYSVFHIKDRGIANPK